MQQTYHRRPLNLSGTICSSEATLAVTSYLVIFHMPQHSFQEDLLHDLDRHRGETDWPVIFTSPLTSLFTSPLTLLKAFLSQDKHYPLTPPLSTKLVESQKTIKVGQAWLLNRFPSSPFQGLKGEVDQPVVPLILLLAYPEDRSDVCFLPVFMNLPQSSWPFKHNRMASQWQQLVPLGYNTSGHMVLWCMSSLFEYSLTRSSSTKGKSLYIQTFPLVSEAWESWRHILPVRTKAEKYTFSLLFPAADVPVEVLHISLHVACKVQFQRGFGFLNPIPACLDSILCILTSHLTLLPPLSCFLFLFQVFSGAPCSSMQASVHRCLPSCM